MSYSIKPSEDGKLIGLKQWGEITSELAMKRNLEAHTLGAKLGITRHFVDLTEARHVDSVTKMYKFAYKDIKIPPGINQQACVALLVSPEDHSHDFVETVTQNTGQNETLFRERGLAIQHLLKDA